MTSAEGAAGTPAAGRERAGADGESQAVGAPEAAAVASRPTGRPAASGYGARGGSVLDFDDPLDRPSADDSDRGWGESFSSADDDFTRFLNEKPPHHL